MGGHHGERVEVRLQKWKGRSTSLAREARRDGEQVLATVLRTQGEEGEGGSPKPTAPPNSSKNKYTFISLIHLFGKK